MNECLICEKHKNFPVPVIAEGKYCYLVHYQTSPETPKMYKGHLFIETKKHCSTYAQLTDEEAQEVGLMIQKGSKALTSVLKPEHLYTLNLGHMVDHLHIHLIPRYAGTPEEYWGGLNLHNWPEAPLIGKEEIEKLSVELKNTIR